MNRTLLATIVFAGALGLVQAHADAPCDGVYRSWGRACHGAAFVRSETIEWNAQFSTCRSSRYDIVDSDLKGETPRVAYRFRTRSRGCQYEVMEIVGKRGGYWSIRGYSSVDDYRQRRDDPSAYDACPVAPMPSARCDLPFARRDRKPHR